MHIYTPVYVYVYVYEYIHIYIYTYSHENTRMIMNFEGMYVCMCVCVCVCVCVCMCVCMRVCVRVCLQFMQMCKHCQTEKKTSESPPKELLDYQKQLTNKKGCKMQNILLHSVVFQNLLLKR